MATEGDARKRLSADQERLLALLDCYTGRDANERDGRRHWLKGLALDIAVFDLVSRGVFDHYALAPALITVHGVSKFAQQSQEAHNDLRYLRKLELVDRVKFATHYHDIAGAYRISAPGSEALAAAAEAVVEPVRSHVRCPACGAYREPTGFAGPPRSAAGPRPKNARAARGREAIWLCARCSSHCAASGPIRVHDPRQCSHCPPQIGLAFFGIQATPFASRPYLPTRRTLAERPAPGAGDGKCRP